MQLYTDRKKQRYFVWFLLLFLISFALRFAIWDFDRTITRDAAFYIQMSECWRANHDFETVLRLYPDFTTPPGIFFAIAFLMNFHLTAEAAGVLLNLVFGSLIPAVTFAIALEILHNRKIAAAAAILTMLHPSMIKLSTAIGRDNVYLFFAGLCLLHLVRGIGRREKMSFCYAGAWWALAFLFRQEAVELAVSAVIVSLAALLYKKISPRFLSVSIVLFFIAGFSLYGGGVYAFGGKEYCRRLYRNYFIRKYHVVVSPDEIGETSR